MQNVFTRQESKIEQEKVLTVRYHEEVVCGLELWGESDQQFPQGIQGWRERD